LSSTRKKILLTSGKRKTAIARATVKSGKGRIRINNIPLPIYQPEIAREKISEPLQLAGREAWEKLDVDIRVKGGGFMGQAEAARMALARVLARWKRGSEIRRRFIEYDRTMLVGDQRRTEPKKFGGPSARTRKQKSYR
jgi:small subunit ribosomal protein S9